MRRSCCRINVWAVAAMMASFACSPNNSADTGSSTTGGSSTGGNATGGTTTGGPVTVEQATDTAVLLVHDVNGAAVTNASLILGDKTFAADATGRIAVAGLPAVGTLLGLLTSPGFQRFPVLLSGAATGGKVRVVVMTKPQVQVSIAANAPATMDLHAHAISLSPNSFTHADGSPYVGNINIAATAFDPTTEVFENYNGKMSFDLRSDFSIDSLPAGAMTMTTPSGALAYAPPEGYVNLDATDDAGNALQLAVDTPAVVHIALTLYTLRKTGDVVPLMSFDPNQASWVQEGNCTVQPIAPERNVPGRLECVGAVKHFSAVGVASTYGSSPFCGCFQPAFKDFTPTSVRMTVQTTQPGVFNFANASDQALTRDGMQCYVNGPAVGRVLVSAAFEGNVLNFGGGDTTFFTTALSTNDLAQFRAGILDHATFKCAVVPVSFSLADAANPPLTDADGDSYAPGGNPADCNDNDASIHPGALETVCDTVDKNCDGKVPAGVATLASASSAAEWNTSFCKLSCAQKTPEVSGNAIDEDCDGIVSDADADGYYNVADPKYVAALAANPSLGADCDDQNPKIHSGALEQTGNGTDEDCDGYAVDADGDNFLSPSQSSVSTANVLGLFPLSDPNLRYRDCDDWNPHANPNTSVLTAESVFAGAYGTDPQTRAAGMCQAIGADGGLNAYGRSLLVDINCDGLYSDLDGDGYTVAGDLSLGVGNDIDCDDLDPRLTTQVPCVLPAATTALDGGNCTPKLQGSRPCRSGFTWSPPVNNCIDINECAQGTAVCGDNNVCINTQGSYECILLQPDTLVVGGLALSNNVPGSVFVSYQLASGTEGMTYTVYYVQGAFSDATVDAVQKEGKNFYVQGNANNFYIAGLSPNANYQVAIVVEDQNSNTGLYGPATATITAPTQTKRAFTVATTSGNLGGVAGADATCAANNPSGLAQSKAFLVDGTNRVACTSISCLNNGNAEHVDWVIQPGTQYTRTDGTPVMISTAYGLQPPQLTNGWAPTGNFYSGVSPGNFVRNYSNCNNFTDGTSANEAMVGWFGDLSLGGIASNYFNCDRTGVFLLCIEQ